MAEFFNRFELTNELHRIIEDAKDYLWLISPYFKLSDSIRQALSHHKGNKKFELIIIYGKNEDDRSKSLSDYDMNFLKSFPNVTIGYHKRLHAKIYLNEKNCLLTFMNLHDYSMKENIEFGILTKASFFGNDNSLDNKAAKFAEYIIDRSIIEHEHYIEREKSFFGFSTKYGDTIVEVDKKRNGYCLRYGHKIPFDPGRPYSIEAFQSWNQYKNIDHTERYCHSCGQPNKTSMRIPLCNNCFKNS